MTINSKKPLGIPEAGRSALAHGVLTCEINLPRFSSEWKTTALGEVVDAVEDAPY